MTNETNENTTDAAPEVPPVAHTSAQAIDHFSLLTFSGLSPEVFRSLNQDQIDEYARAYWAQRGVK